MHKKPAFALALFIIGGATLLQTLVAISRARRLDEQKGHNHGTRGYQDALKARRVVLAAGIVVWAITWAWALFIFLEP